MEDFWKVGDAGSGVGDGDDVLVEILISFLCKIYNNVVAVQNLYLTICLMAVTEDPLDIYI